MQKRNFPISQIIYWTCVERLSSIVLYLHCDKHLLEHVIKIKLLESVGQVDIVQCPIETLLIKRSNCLSNTLKLLFEYFLLSYLHSRIEQINHSFYVNSFHFVKNCLFANISKIKSFDVDMLISQMKPLL